MWLTVGVMSDKLWRTQEENILYGHTGRLKYITFMPASPKWFSSNKSSQERLISSHYTRFEFMTMYLGRVLCILVGWRAEQYRRTQCALRNSRCNTISARTGKWKSCMHSAWDFGLCSHPRWSLHQIRIRRWTVGKWDQCSRNEQQIVTIRNTFYCRVTEFQSRIC